MKPGEFEYYVAIIILNGMIVVALTGPNTKFQIFVGGGLFFICMAWAWLAKYAEDLPLIK
jgi:predicted butyrate kinase (DUF1464 family)